LRWQNPRLPASTLGLHSATDWYSHSHMMLPAPWSTIAHHGALP
jgi:hypothetical protein